MTPPANAACKAPVHVHQQFLSRLWLSVDSGTLQDAEPADLWKLKGTIAKAGKRDGILLQNWSESMVENITFENGR